MIDLDSKGTMPGKNAIGRTFTSYDASVPIAHCAGPNVTDVYVYDSSRLVAQHYAAEESP